jgi:hypothetical protein
LEGFEESKGGMANWFDSFASITIVHVSLYVLALMWPIVFSGDEFQCSGLPWMSGNECIIVIMQEVEAEFVVLGNPDQSFVHEKPIFFLA